MKSERSAIKSFIVALINENYGDAAKELQTAINHKIKRRLAQAKAVKIFK